MKTTFALLTLTLVAVVLHTSWAKPRPQFAFNIGVGGSISLPFNQLIPTESIEPASYLAEGTNNDNSNDVNSVAQSRNIIANIFNGINEAIRNGTTLGVETARTFFENVFIASEAFLNNANDLGEVIGDNFRELVHQGVANFRAVVHAFITGVDQEILAVRNRIKRQALIEVETRLEDIYNSLNGLHGHVEDLRVNWQHDVEHQEMIVVRRWNIWAGEQLEKVADATNGDEQKLAEAEAIINEFVNRYGNYLTQCADEAEEELQEYEQQVDKTVQRYEPILGSLIGEVDQCLQDYDTTAAGRRCSRQFKKHLTQIRDAPADFAKLTSAGAQLAVGSFENRYCVAQTLIEFGLEKFTIERQLVQLVFRQKEAENGDDNAEGNEEVTVSNSSENASAESGSSEENETEGSAASGEGSAGSSAEGSEESASEAPESEESGSVESGSVVSGSAESGSEAPESVESGSVESGSVESGSGSVASEESGSNEESASETSEAAGSSQESASEASNESTSEASNESASEASNESASEASNESASTQESASEASIEDGQAVAESADSEASGSSSVSESDESAVDAAASVDSSSGSESDESVADADASDESSISDSSNSSE